MMQAKKATADEVKAAALKAQPRPDFENVEGPSDSIPWSVVDEQTTYIKLRHRSDDPIEFWTKHGYAATFDAAQAADIRRLALIDSLHQEQLQRRALAAGTITESYDFVPPAYTQDYAALQGVRSTAGFRGTPVDAALHMTGVPATNAEDKEDKDRGDAALGFPPAVPLFGVDGQAESYIASIDRWPAALLTRRLCRMAYEEPNKPLMIQGMVELAETGAPEGYRSPLYKLPGHAAPQDKAGTGADREYAYTAPATPKDARFPAHFFTPQLLKDTPFAEAQFRLGDDDDGETLRAKMKVFLQYLDKNKDDSPLYLFEDSVDRCAISRPLLSQYRVPSFFAQDLVTDVIPPRQRPPYQWLLIGPRRSGTRMHLDPRCTGAWNMSTTGRKRWVLMRPGIPANVAKGHVVMNAAEVAELGVRGNPQAVHFFTSVLPRLRRWIQRREQKRAVRLYNQRAAAEGRPLLPEGKDTLDAQARRHMLADGVAGAGADAAGLRFAESVTADADFGLNDPFLSVDADEEAGVTGGAATGGDEADTEDAGAEGDVDGNGVPISRADRARALAKGKRIQWDELRDGYGYCEFIQYPGETIFVPSGWWHAVINVDDTVAYTQNFTNMSNFPLVWRNMRAHNKRTTRRWLRQMDREAKPFAALARAINEHDGYKLSEFRPTSDPSPIATVTDSSSGAELTASDSSSYVSSFEETDHESE